MSLVAQHPGQFFLQRCNQMRGHHEVVLVSAFPTVPLGLGAFQFRQRSFDLFGGGHV